MDYQASSCGKIPSHRDKETSTPDLFPRVQAIGISSTSPLGGDMYACILSSKHHPLAANPYSPLAQASPAWPDHWGRSCGDLRIFTNLSWQVHTQDARWRQPSR